MASSEIECSPLAVAIGASAGAVEALGHILPALPAGYHLPVFVVVHVPAHGRSLLAELFAPRCALRVVEAEDKLRIEPGTVYFCPPDYHLLVESPEELSLSIDGPMRFSRPSIDVLFESVADAYGERAVGVILSGANDDGAAGLRAISSRGGRAIVQTPESAHAGAMPVAARRAVPQSVMLDPPQIAQMLVHLGT